MIRWEHTVVDSPLDFFTGRLTKKEMKATLAEELLSDQKSCSLLGQSDVDRYPIALVGWKLNTDGAAYS
ncbi:hypothetical protein RIF29_35181 [Crotalaria pallida]|uniref:Uncharacterized protein n=1 Tax=Crotalaria pallida TaxID=3830 RepID=A0AAN9EFK8_CROPI